MTCCLNPSCQQPQNPDDAGFCQSCGAKLSALLRGRYRVIQPLGQGGFGRTYLAIDEDRLKTRCVIKQFAPQVQGPRSLEKAVLLFEQEAIRLNELGEHPQIPTLLAYFVEEASPTEKEKRLYLVQQFIEGQTLSQELHQQGAFSEQQIRELLADLLPVLKFVHECQVVHRDITPSNIVRRKLDGKLVLIDFGVAKLLTAVSPTQAGTKLGTEGYSPMEQFRSGKAYPASDLYSLGATCVYLMTQVKPEDLYDPLAGRWLWRSLLAEKGIELSEGLGQILDKLLKDLVNERYQSANEVLQDLNSLPANPLNLNASTARGAATSPAQSVAKPPTSRAPTTRPPASKPPTSPPPGSRLSGAKPSASRPPLSGQSQPGKVQPAIATPADGWRCVRTLKGHSSWVMAVAVNSRRQLLVSGGLDDMIKIWNLQTGNLLRTVPGHLKAVNSVAISSDGQILVSSSDDTTVKVWSMHTGDLLHKLSGHLRDVNAVAISPDGQILASGSEDRTVRLWKLGTGELLRILTGTVGMIKSVAMSPSGRVLASGGLDNQIKLWNLTNGELIRTLHGHFNSVNAVAISPDGKTLISGSKDKTIKLWNLSTGDLIRSIAGHADIVNAIAVSPDGKTIISGSSDKTIKIWNLVTGELIGTLAEHSNPVSAIAISSGGQLFASGSWDNTIKIWQMSV